MPYLKTSEFLFLDGEEITFKQVPQPFRAMLSQARIKVIEILYNEQCPVHDKFRIQVDTRFKDYDVSIMVTFCCEMMGKHYASQLQGLTARVDLIYVRPLNNEMLN